MPEHDDLELDLRDGERHGVIVGLDDRVATIVVTDPVGVDDEWFFPAAMVPAELGVEARVVIKGAGPTLSIAAEPGIATTDEPDLTGARPIP